MRKKLEVQIPEAALEAEEEGPFDSKIKIK